MRRDTTAIVLVTDDGAGSGGLGECRFGNILNGEVTGFVEE